jgi:hypothetical protein
MKKHQLLPSLTLAAALVLCLSLPPKTQAGVIDIPPAPTPLPASAPVDGDASLIEPAQPDVYDPVAEAALSLLQTVLSLL